MSHEEIPEHESGVRRMMAEAFGSEYVAYESLAEAREDPDAAMILEGDWGGQIYVACPVRVVGASEEAIRALLTRLDAIAWDVNDGEGASVLYERTPAGAGIAGGMGGGAVDESIWVHEEFVGLGLDEAIRRVVRGEQDALPPG